MSEPRTETLQLSPRTVAFIGYLAGHNVTIPTKLYELYRSDGPAHGDLVAAMRDLLDELRANAVESHCRWGRVSGRADTRPAADRTETSQCRVQGGRWIEDEEEVS